MEVAPKSSKKSFQATFARGVRVFFSRVPPPHSQVFELFERSGIVENVGGRSHFVANVDEALRLTEVLDLENEDVDGSLVV